MFEPHKGFDLAGIMAASQWLNLSLIGCAAGFGLDCCGGHLRCPVCGVREPYYAKHIGLVNANYIDDQKIFRLKRFYVAEHADNQGRDVDGFVVSHALAGYDHGGLMGGVVAVWP